MPFSTPSIHRLNSSFGVTVVAVVELLIYIFILFIIFECLTLQMHMHILPMYLLRVREKSGRRAIRPTTTNERKSQYKIVQYDCMVGSKEQLTCSLAFLCYTSIH